MRIVLDEIDIRLYAGEKFRQCPCVGGAVVEVFYHHVFKGNTAICFLLILPHGLQQRRDWIFFSDTHYLFTDVIAHGVQRDRQPHLHPFFGKLFDAGNNARR